MKNSKLFIVLLVVVLIIGAFFIFRDGDSENVIQDVVDPVSNGDSQPVQKANVSGSFIKGESTPNFSFIDFDGNLHSVSDYFGRAIVIDFWAAWCPFCVEEMPLLQKAQEKYGDDVEIIGMHRTFTESLNVGKEFAADRGVSYLLATDPNDSLYKAAGGFGMPVAIFINKDGVVTEIKSGPKTEEEIDEKIGKLIDGG